MACSVKVNGTTLSNYRVMKRYILKTRAIFVTAALAASVIAINACHTRTCNDKAGAAGPSGMTIANDAQPLQQNAPQTKIATIVYMQTLETGVTEVLFRELAEPLTVSDINSVAVLKNSFAAKRPVNVTFDPWQGVIRRITPVSDNDARIYNDRRGVANSAGFSVQLQSGAENIDDYNNAEALGVLNTTTSGLTNVIPDMATAQLMFDYITHQCCALPGPFTIDHCISFQYCQDGCYARAHKMCWILNNKYNYETHKIFSFAYPSSYTLSVQAQKWGGCCIRWWYHVAPLVNIKTPAGIKAYVFDPAMFNQPVLLATWLHAQENPVCAGSKTPKVTSFKIQPTSSFWPNDTSTFDPDPTYYYTNSTLTSYAPLKTCP